MKKITRLITASAAAAGMLLLLALALSGCPGAGMDPDPGAGMDPDPGTENPAQGTADISVTAPPEFSIQDTWHLSAAESETVTISKSGANSVPVNTTFTATDTASLVSPAYVWRFDGVQKGTGTSVTVNAADSETGGHSLSLEISAGGKSWSNRIRITVAE